MLCHFVVPLFRLWLSASADRREETLKERSSRITMLASGDVDWETEINVISGFDFDALWGRLEEVLRRLSRTPVGPLTKDRLKTEQVFSDGHRQLVFTSGLRKAQTLTGWHVVFFPNGDVKAGTP
eukprot:Selendium_serpulae@DN5940_c0_g2_i1.p2